MIGDHQKGMSGLGRLVLVVAATVCLPLLPVLGKGDEPPKTETAVADAGNAPGETDVAGEPQRGGMLAKSGPNISDGVDATLDSFEDRSVTSAEKEDPSFSEDDGLDGVGEVAPLEPNDKALEKPPLLQVTSGREKEEELAKERQNQQKGERVVGNTEVPLEEEGEPGLLALLGESILRHKKEKEPAKERRIQQEIERIVGDIKVSLEEEGKPRQLDLIRGPLLRHETPPYFVQGTIWAWGTHGRPQALLSLALSSCTGGSAADPHWYYEMVSLSTKPISATTRNNTWWSTQTAGWNPKPIPDAPVVAATPEERLRQMKDLARRFSAHRYATYKPGPKRLEKVSLLDEPILRYATSSGDTVDGAIFVFSGWVVNPEIFLTIEAERDPQGTVTWKYNASRSGIYEFVLKWDGREVWHPEAINATKVSDTYHTYGISAKEEIRLSEAKGH